MGTIKQDRPLRLKILSLLLNPKWLAIYGNNVILPEFFEEDDEQAFAKSVLLFKEAYYRPPTDPEDVIALLDGDDDDRESYADLIYEIFDDAKSYDTDLPSDVVVQFAKEQAVKNAILEGIDYIRKGDLQTPYGMMGEAMKVGESLLMPGIDIVDDVDAWLYEYWLDKIRTPWPPVNIVYNGGLSRGELGVILAPTNVGKSMALVDIGYAAAGIGSGLNVIHFTHEMAPAVTAKRYAARMTFRFLKRGTDTGAYEVEFLETARRLMPGKVRVIGGAAKMKFSELHGHVVRLIAEGFNPGLIIDDYADLIEPDFRMDQRRFELSNIYRDLRALGGEFDTGVWTASQSHRDSMKKEIVTLDTISEDIGKAQIADIIIAVCQTPEELAADKCRLFNAKCRDGKKGHLWDGKFYSDQQAIIVTGFAKKREKKDA